MTTYYPTFTPPPIPQTKPDLTIKYRRWTISVYGNMATITNEESHFEAHPFEDVGELVSFCKRKIRRLNDVQM